MRRGDGERPAVPTMTLETAELTDAIGDALIHRIIPADRPHTYCEHLNSGPQPFFATSALPGAFFCRACFGSGFMTRRLRGHDQTQSECDACVTDVGGPNALHPVQAMSGSATLLGSVCDRCVEALGTTGQSTDDGSEADRFSLDWPGTPVMILAPRLKVT